MHVGKNSAVELVDFAIERLQSVGHLGTAMERLSRVKLPSGIPRAVLHLLDPNMLECEKKSIFFHYFIRHKLLLIAVWGLLPDE
jgi:hypothetical protein